jgi:hypothetical protein
MGVSGGLSWLPRIRRRGEHGRACATAVIGYTSSVVGRAYGARGIAALYALAAACGGKVEPSAGENGSNPPDTASAAPAPAPSRGTAGPGDPCFADEACRDETATCGTNFPGGFCAVPCTETCSVSAAAPLFCTAYASGKGFCHVVCDPKQSICRPGYTCKLAAHASHSGESAFVCFPEF